MNNQTTFELKTMWTIGGAVLLLMVLVAGWTWMQLPADAQVPIHWNIAGEPDDFAGKSVGLFLLPGVTLLVIVLLSLIRYIDPKRANIAHSAQAYRATFIGLLLLFFTLHIASILYIMGVGLNIGYVVAPAVGIIFMLIGNYMGKIRPNYTFGVRTPWTLASELAWNKTHRMAGKLFMLVGLGVVAMTLWNPIWAFYLLIGGLVTILALTMIYSYLIWKRDPAVQQKGLSS